MMMDLDSVVKIIIRQLVKKGQSDVRSGFGDVKQWFPEKQ